MAGKYQAYPDYKDSGVEWLGEIPNSWECIKLKYISGLRGEKVEPNGKESYVGMENIESWSGCYFQKNNINPEGLSIRFLENDVLFGKLRPYLAKSWLADFSGICSSEFLVLNSYGISPRFINYYTLTEEFIETVDSSTYGSKMPRASWDFIGLIGVPVPSDLESEIIADFLDYETAQIDTLIDKQQQLIQLLKEKRQAVINHAVTKGLNPDATMKDSGIEWLGEVPEHWAVKNLRYLGACQNGINIGVDSFGSGYPFVSYGDVYKNEVLPEIGSGLVQSTAQDRLTYSVVHGDVLFTRTSETIEEIGYSSVCFKTIDDATFAGFIIRFRPDYNSLLAGFSKYYFRNLLLRVFFIKEMNLVTRASLSQDLLKKLPISLPSIDEQREISEFLDQKTETFERLITKSESVILLMQERRSALISAAVTGKIDVRGWQPPAKSQPC